MNEKSVHVLEGTSVEVLCAIEASPRSVSYWVKEPLFSRSYGYSSSSSDNQQQRQNVLQSNDKYDISETLTSHYRVALTMKILNFSESDVGAYTCTASNVMGRANGTIRLYGKCQLVCVSLVESLPDTFIVMLSTVLTEGLSLP